METEATTDDWTAYDGDERNEGGLTGLAEEGEDWATLEATEPEGWPEYYRRLAEHGLEEGSFAALASQRVHIVRERAGDCMTRGTTATKEK